MFKEVKTLHKVVIDKESKEVRNNKWINYFLKYNFKITMFT